MQANQHVFSVSARFNWPVRPSATLTRHDLSLPKTPTGAIVPSKPPGIGRMSVYGSTSMKSKNLKRVCYLLVAVASGAVPVAASADQKSCPDRIVVGKHGPYDECAYSHDGTIYSASIPSKPGIKFTCTYEGRNGMLAKNYTLELSEFIGSLGYRWQKRQDTGTYTCTG
jgi:hypothetical protein